MLQQQFEATDWASITWLPSFRKEGNKRFVRTAHPCCGLFHCRLIVWGSEISSRRWRRLTLKQTNYSETSLRWDGNTKIQATATKLQNTYVMILVWPCSFDGERGTIHPKIEKSCLQFFDFTLNARHSEANRSASAHSCKSSRLCLHSNKCKIHNFICNALLHRQILLRCVLNILPQASVTFTESNEQHLLLYLHNNVVQVYSSLVLPWTDE